MKFKHIIVTISVALICTAAFAKWPFGYIGLNVDQPVGQFDVGGDLITRGRILITASDEDPQYPIENLMNNDPGIYIYNSANDDAPGFKIWNDELTGVGLRYTVGESFEINNGENEFLNIGFNEARHGKLINNQWKEQQINFNPGSILFTNTPSVDVTNTINSSDIVNSQMYVYLAKTDDQCSCTINLKVNVDYNFHLKIFSDNYGDGGLIKVQVYGHDWFSLTGIDEDQCIELEYLAGFHSKKRWQFMNAFNCYSIENIANEVNWLSSDNGRISYDGSEVEP